MNKIYIISGPAGAGKSTISKGLAEQFENSAYIEGDLINHMVVGGYLPPWKSKESLSLVWDNIADLSINFVQANKDIIIDYVAFPDEVERFSEKIYAEVKNAEIRCVVLWVERKELLRRDSLRIQEHQMGLRCVELLNEFEAKGKNKRFLYDTTYLQPSDLDEAFVNIKNNSSFKY
ncbi:AAA family ATPase [Psychrobacillus sp. FSL W7-1457]|uniref:AAA family ATPase n=1 Tax=unclassified Psychrobacillus TaxID=2636677 RepID=UPI0030F6F918